MSFISEIRRLPRMIAMRRSWQVVVLVASLSGFSTSTWAAALNACDLDANGAVNDADVTLARNMSVGLVTPCTATVMGSGVCNVVVVQRVVNARGGGNCVLGNSHSVTLNWVASTTPNVTYRVHRGTTSGGPYTVVNSVAVSGTTYVDTTVLAGVTYYYVVSAVDSSNNQSGYSNQAVAAVPTP